MSYSDPQAKPIFRTLPKTLFAAPKMRQMVMPQNSPLAEVTETNILKN